MEGAPRRANGDGALSAPVQTPTCPGRKLSSTAAKLRESKLLKFAAKSLFLWLFYAALWKKLASSAINLAKLSRPSIVSTNRVSLG